MRFIDRTGERIGKLVLVSWEQKVIKVGQQWVKRIYWLGECECGETREVTSRQLAKGGESLSCLECETKSNQEKWAAGRQRSLREESAEPVMPRGENSPYMMNYEHYRAGFTVAQRARYEELLRGRRGVRLEQEAVDVVMREPVPGVCCELCLRDEPPPEGAEEETDLTGNQHLVTSN